MESDPFALGNQSSLTPLILVKNVIALETKMPAEHAQAGISDNWLPFVDAYRTICIAPSSEARAEFEAIRELGSEA